jgi:phage-related minor tail protein
MSTEEAGLSIKIDSSDAPRAAADLDKVTAAGVKTEDVAKRVKKSWLDTIQSVGADTAAMSSKFDVLNSTQSKMLAVVERVATQLDRMATAMERTASRSSAVTDAANKNAEALDKVERSSRAAEAASKSLSETEDQAAARYRAIAQSATEAAAARARDADALRQAATAERELTAAQGSTAASAAATRAQLGAQNAQFQSMTNEINQTSAALTSIGRGAGSMQAVQVQTDKLIKLWSTGKITAEQYDVALKQIDASEAALAASSAKASAAGDKFIQNLKEQAATAGLTARQLLEYRAAQLGVSDKAAPLIEQLATVNKSFGSTATSAKQTAAAMRGVPAQFTDIVTSLRGGQAPITVLLQQGGQLRDMFGSVGAAARALGTFMLGLINPYVILAAAVGTLGLAYFQGSQESVAYNKALVMSGNYAGVTSGQMGTMAASIARISGTQGGAAQALTALASTGQVAGKQMEGFALAAVKAKDAWGQSIDDTVKNFVRLGEAPSETLLKLNEGQNFLTASIYKQVAALEEQGKKTDAARLAQDTYANATVALADNVKQQAGALERAWDGIASTAKRAWDAMLNVGRPQSLADMKQQFSAVQAQLADLQQNQGMVTAPGGARFGGGNNRAAQAITRLQAQSDQLRSAITAEDAKTAETEAQGAAVQLEKTKTENTKWITAQQQAMRTRNQMRDDELAQIRVKGANSAATQQQVDDLIENVKKKYEDKGSTSSVAANVSAHAQQMADIESQIQAEEQLAKSLDLYGAAADKANSGDKLVLKIQNELTLAVVNRANKQTDAQLKEALARAQVLAADQKANDARQKAIKLNQDYDAWQDKLSDGTKALSDTLAEQTALYGKTGEARTIATAQSKILRDAEKFLADEQRKGITVTDDMAAKVRDYAKANADLTGSIMAQSQAYQGAQQLMDENKKFAADSILDETARNKALTEIDADAWRQRIKLAGDGTDAQQKLIEQYDTWYANQLSKPQIEQAKQLISDLDRVFQDGFANMLNGGKGTWESFTQSLVTTFKTTVADQIYKMFVKPIIVQLVGSLTGVSGLGGSSSSGSSDLISGFMSLLGLSGASGSNAPSGTGGGNLMGGLNTASTVNTLYGLMKNGFSGISDTISSLIGKITGQVATDSVASATANSAAAAIAEGLGQGAGAAALDTAATAAASAAAEAAASTSGALIADGLGTAVSAATSTAATAAAAEAAGAAATTAASAAAGGLGAQLASKLVASWPVALAYAVWQNDKMYKDGVRYEDMDVTGVGSVVNAPMKFVDDTLNKIGLSGRVANLLSGLALSAMVWGKNGMFGGETRYGSGPFVGYSTDNQVQGEGGPSGGDPNLDNTKAIVQKNYDNTRDLITALGGTADALYMFNDWELSPKNGNSFVRSVVRNDAGDGGPDFDNRIDLDTKDYGDVMTAYMTEMKRSMLAAVANSNVNSVYKDYLANNGDLKTADDATLTGLMEGIQKIQAFSVALKELPFANMRGLTLEAGMSLANFMGGLDKFQASMDSYFNNYYSDSEKFNKLTTDVTRQFANIGLDLPTSKAQFRQMAEALDLSTKSGRDTYVAMMNLQQGFSDYEATVGQVADAITQAAQQQAAAAQQQQDALKQTLSGNVQAAYDRESQALQARVDNLNSFVDALDKLQDSLNLGDLSPLSPQDKLAEAKRQYEETLAKAQGGDEGAQSDLATAAQNYLNASKGWNASSEAYADTFAKVQADLAITKASASSALDIAKQQLDEMKKSVEGILKLDDSVQSLADALAAYASAFGSGNAYLGANPDVNQAFQQDPGGMNANQYAAYHYAAYGAGEGRNSTGVVMNPADEYLMNNPDVLAAYQAGNGGGMTPEQYAAFHYATYGAGEGRSFAVGTNYVPYDMKADIHEGERIIPKADNRALMDMLQRPASSSSDDVCEELRELKETIAQLLKAGLNQQAAIAEKDTAERGKLVDASRRSSLVTNG